MKLFRIISALIAILVLCESARCQTPSIVAEDSIETLFARVEASLTSAEQDQLPLYSPGRYKNAVDALAEAKLLNDRGSDPRLIRIQLKGALDHLETAKQVASKVRATLTNALAERIAALDAGASNGPLWTQTEFKLSAMIRDIELNRYESTEADAESLAVEYRVARRTALRNDILSSARAEIQTAEDRNASKTVPTLFARAQQALTRAESAVAQENLDQARLEAANAAIIARHAVAMMNDIDRVSVEKYPWESALLPYSDALEEIAALTGYEITFEQGGASAAKGLAKHIRQWKDSLSTEADARESLESQLGEAQTELANSHNRIVEMEKRIADLERDRSVAQDDLSKRKLFAERMQTAQSFFEPTDVTVLQDENGNIVFRVYGIKFASGATTLTKNQEKLVESLAKAIQSFPDAAITVEGHTDSDGGEDANQSLSEKRASAVAKVLEKSLPIAYAPPKVIGYGESRPIADNENKNGRAQNRRIDVLLDIP